MLRFPAASQPKLSNVTMTPLCLSPLVWMASSFWQLKFLQAAAVNTQTMEPMSTDLFTCLTNNCFPSLTSRITSHLVPFSFIIVTGFIALFSLSYVFSSYFPSFYASPSVPTLPPSPFYISPTPTYIYKAPLPPSMIPPFLPFFNSDCLRFSSFHMAFADLPRKNAFGSCWGCEIPTLETVRRQTSPMTTVKYSTVKLISLPNPSSTCLPSLAWWGVTIHW